MRAPVVLVDERHPESVRARIGELLRQADTADFAVSRIRLGALDLTARETDGVRRCRVLLGRLDAGMLLEAAEAMPVGAAERLEVLRSFAASGRLEVRAAGMAAWVPDFSLYASAGPGESAGRPRRRSPLVALLGAHYFGSPEPFVEPSFTAMIGDPAAVRLLRDRFAELWELGHDVLPAIGDVLERAHALALAAGGRGGGRDRPGAAR
jgi:hypothetical protein